MERCVSTKGENEVSAPIVGGQSGIFSLYSKVIKLGFHPLLLLRERVETAETPLQQIDLLQTAPFELSLTPTILENLTNVPSGSVTARSRSLRLSDHSKMMVSAGPHTTSKPQTNDIGAAKARFLTDCTLYDACTLQLYRNRHKGGTV